MIQDMIIYAVKMMLLAVIKAFVKYKNILNTAALLEYFFIKQLLLRLLTHHNINKSNMCVHISSSVRFTR